RWIALGIFGLLIGVTLTSLPTLGREFMPELEEGNTWIRGTFPVNVSLNEVADKARTVRKILRRFPEIAAAVPQVGRPDDGTDPTGYYNLEVFVPLRPQKEWPKIPQKGRPRTKNELIREMDHALSTAVPGIDWGFSQNIRDNVMEALSGVKGENSVKLFGPSLEELEQTAEQIKAALSGVPGVENVGIYRIKGQCNLEFPIDRARCSLWNVSVADVENVIQTAVGGKAFSQMIEGEKTFDITLRWPERLRRTEQAILDIPVDVTAHTVATSPYASQAGTYLSGPSFGPSATGTSNPAPSLTGSLFQAFPGALSLPRLRRGDLVTPLDDEGQPTTPDKGGSFLRQGASTISREQGQRHIAIKFGVRGRDLAGAVEEARTRVAPLVPVGYRTEW